MGTFSRNNEYYKCNDKCGGRAIIKNHRTRRVDELAKRGFRGTL